MKKRRCFKQSLSLYDRLSAFIHAMRERAELVGPGPERDEILKKVKKRRLRWKWTGPSIPANRSLWILPPATVPSDGSSRRSSERGHTKAVT